MDIPVLAPSLLTPTVAILSPDTLKRAWDLGIKPRESLANNDGHSFFQALEIQ